MKGVIIKVPATSANIGPGFDCLGIALDLWNELRVVKSDNFKISIEGEGKKFLEPNENNLVVKSTKYIYDYFGKDFPNLEFHCNNKIPLAKGLGSSAAATISGLLAGWALVNNTLKVDTEVIFKLASEFDGHPDNAAPCLYGGLCISYNQEYDQNDLNLKNKLFSHSKIDCNLSEYKCVIFLPDEILKTNDSRSLVPSQVSMSKAIFNISRTALLISSISSGKFDLLKLAMQDTLHQPYRNAQVKHLDNCIKSALANGAWGAHLSGSGPSIIAWCPNEENKINQVVKNVADSLIHAANTSGVRGSTLITQIINIGAILNEIEF